MRTLKFTKMQGAGNDFVMLDGIRQDIEPTPALIRYLADRRFGIGADQVLIFAIASSTATGTRSNSAAMAPAVSPSLFVKRGSPTRRAFALRR